VAVKAMFSVDFDGCPSESGKVEKPGVIHDPGLFSGPLPATQIPGLPISH
jgi:hypothetical protein